MFAAINADKYLGKKTYSNWSRTYFDRCLSVLSTRPQPPNNYYNQRPQTQMMAPAPPPSKKAFSFPAQQALTLSLEPNMQQAGFGQLPLESMMAPSSSKYVWHIDYHELVIEQLIGQGTSEKKGVGSLLTLR